LEKKNKLRFSHGMTRPTKTDSRTGKENKLLSKKELEDKLKDELLKEISLGEKKIVRSYIFKGKQK
jgi:hypothetical protein